MDALKGVVRRNWRAAVASVAILTDALIVAAAIVLAAQLESPQRALGSIVLTHGFLIAFAVVVFLLIFTSLGVYRTVSYTTFQRQSFRAGKGFVYGTAVLLSTLFLLQDLQYSRMLILFFLVVFPIVYLVVWTVVRSWMRALHRGGFGRWNTLAIGTEPHILRLLRRLEDYPELGFDVVGVITAIPDPGDHGTFHVERDRVESAVRDRSIGLITFSSAELNGSFDELEDLCRERRIPMRVISPESEILFAKAGLHDIAGVSLYMPDRIKIERLKQVTKRLFDIAGASACLLLLSPVFLLVAAATKIESRGPVFFRQKRALTGEDVAFDFYKFRSMIAEADEMKLDLMTRNETSGPLFKIKDDPRLTHVGRFIRKYSIDELPQLFNVLKGDMSLVGPRPLPVRDLLRMKEEDHMGGYFRQRAKAKPGMTGLWQVSGRSDIGFREMVLLDLYYIERQTILFDVEILAQTIPTVLFGRGAY
jgi:exopolysaccharide biosynthesis polyprenyl glycosylphosphotransferase